MPNSGKTLAGCVPLHNSACAPLCNSACAPLCNSAQTCMRTFRVTHVSPRLLRHGSSIPHDAIVSNSDASDNAKTGVSRVTHVLTMGKFGTVGKCRNGKRDVHFHA